MNRRWVVQEHRLAPGDVHYDLMIEDGEVLVTFQLEAPPTPGAAVRGQRSFDHRPKYLSYQGPISCDRGEVSIWDRGELIDVEHDPRAARYTADVTGQRLQGRLVLDGASGQEGAAVEVRLS